MTQQMKLRLAAAKQEMVEEEGVKTGLSHRFDWDGSMKMAMQPPNNILRLDTQTREPSRRVYARIDSIDDVGEGSRDRLALMDAVDANWVDQQGDGVRSLSSADIREMPTSVVAVTVDSTSRKRPAFSEMRGWRPGDWLQADYNDGPSSVLVSFYTGLFADPIEARASFARSEPSLKAKLDAAFSLDQIPDASIEKVSAILAKGDGAASINVLDVGQGNAIGLSRRKHDVSLYFDFGGGILTNARTFPRIDPTACISSTSAIVLSHWDWDHWSSGCRSPQALECDWLVPRQKLGAVHRAFATELLERGHLHIWPSSLPSLTVGQITVEHCTGKDQNNSGLSMIVKQAPRRKKKSTVLLPGDADYNSIPSVLKGVRFNGVVASHHGSRVRSIASVAAPRSGGTLVYSYGSGNVFGHPRLHSQLDYLRAGWKPDNTLSTTQSVMRRPSNIAVSLTKERPHFHCARCASRYITEL